MASGWQDAEAPAWALEWPSVRMRQKTTQARAPLSPLENKNLKRFFTLKGTGKKPAWVNGVWMGWADGWPHPFGWPHPRMGGATHRDPWDKQGGPFFRAANGRTMHTNPLSKRETHRVGGPSKPHCTAMDSVAANRRLNASVQRMRSTLAGHSAGPRETKTTSTNANRAIRIAMQRSQGLRGPNSVSLGGDMTANER